MWNIAATRLWIGAAFVVALCLAASVLTVFGTGERGIYIALRATARWSFLLFWLAYSGGAMATLFSPMFQPLAKRGREFGLAFASAHLVHAGLVVWLYRISVGLPVPNSSLIIFGTGLFWTYFLALFSIRRFPRLPGPRTWRLVRTVGVEYIALVFLLDFARNPFRGGFLYSLEYLPFMLLGIAGTAMRLAAIPWRLAHLRTS
jgi:hypothetical protein